MTVRATELAWPFGPTGAYVTARALNVLGYVNTLHQQIMSSDVTPEFKEAWGAFYRSAANFLVAVVMHRSSILNPLPWLSSSDVAAQIEAYAGQAIEWRQSFQSAGGHPVGPAVVPIEPPESKTPWWLKWTVGGLVVAGLGYVTYRTGIWKRYVGRKLEFAS